MLVEKDHKALSLKRQCELIEVSRTGLYYKPKGESAENLLLMRLMDKHCLEHPEKGVEQLYMWLNMDCELGFQVNRKRIRRLLRKMGVMAMYPKKNLSAPGEGHEIYPYLLRHLNIEKANQVWATDITYVPMKQGFIYLMAIIDVYSRRILHWSISNTMEANWCVEVLKETLQMHGKPEIFNTDQGSQFTSKEFTGVLKDAEIKISMDGKGRATDNAFIERFWRTVKYDYIYLHEFTDGLALYRGLDKWINYYNLHRRHTSLDCQTPYEAYQMSINSSTKSVPIAVKK